MKKLICGLFAVLAVVAAQTGVAAIQVADELLVDVAASDVTFVGNGNGVASWQNKGSLGGTFDAWGDGAGATYYDNVRGAKALWFNGTSNTVLVASFTGTPSQLSGGNNTWSAEFWILSPHIMNQADFMSWTRRPGSNGNDSVMEFRYGTDGQLAEHWGNNTQWGTKPPQGQWHHVVLTRDLSKVERVYVNGVLVNTETRGALSIRSDGRMVFGATMNLDNDNFNFLYNGYIAQARIHTGVLNDGAIANNYAEEAPLYNPTPHAAGTVFVDITAGTLSSLTDGDFVLSWPNSGILAKPFASTESAFGPTYHSDVQGAPAVLFDASVSNVLVGASVPAQLTGNPSYTMEAWLNCPEFRTAEAAFLSWTPRSAATGMLMEFRYYNNAAFGEHYAIYTRWPNNTPPAADRWHHVATTRDAATGETFVYINGLPANAQTLTGFIARGDGAFILGGVELPNRTGFQPNWGYNGYMGALRISAGVKSATDILATYSTEAPAYGLTSIDGDGIWVSPNGGNWSTGANWDPQVPVNGATKTANFLNGGGAVVNDVSGLNLFGMFLGYPGTDISGNPITFADGGILRNFEGTNTVSAPLVLNGQLTAAPGIGAKALVVSGGISGTGPLVSFGGTTILSGNNTFSGGLTHQRGTLEINGLTALGTGPVTLGDGTFRYTGASDTCALPISTEALGRPTAIEVTQPGTTLTLTGKFDGNTPFAKRGPGALTFAHAGDQVLNASSPASSATYTYSVDGLLADGTFGSFAVEEGTVTLGAANQTTTIRNNQNFYVGMRNTTAGKSAAMYVTAGTLSFPNGSWLCINRGALGDAALYISGADTRVQTGGGLALANTDAMPNHNGTALLDMDGGTFTTVGENALIGESATATSIVNLRNGAVFESNIRYNKGLSIAEVVDAPATFTADSASTVRANNLMVNRRGTLEVKNGARLENDMPGSPAFVHNHASFNKGTVTFDNGTFALRTVNGFGLWLHDMPSVFVGNGGITLESSNWATLDPVLIPAAGATSAAVSKTGTGSVSIRPTALPVSVTEGTLAFYNNTVQSFSNPPPAGAVSMAGGDIAPLTDGAFFNQTLYPSDTDSFLFAPSATLRFRDAWQLNNPNGTAGFVRNDGWFRFANNGQSQTSLLFLREKQRVTGPWTVSFSFIGEGIVADGFTFMVQNDDRGLAATGAGGGSLGYAGINNSLAIGFNANVNQGGYVQYRTLGNTSTNILTLNSTFALRDAGVKTHVTISYDGTDTLSCVLRRANGRVESCAVTDVDISELIGGGDMAYIGFSGATGGSIIQQGYLADFVWNDGVTSAFYPEVTQYGGNIVLGDGTLNATFDNSTALPSVASFDTLTFTDGATLNTDITIKPEKPEFAYGTGIWQLNGHAAWRPDGGISLERPEQNSLGAFFSKNRYDVTNAWTATFTYQQGNQSTDPADFVAFAIQNVSPTQNTPGEDPRAFTNGLTVLWEYYRTRPATRLFLYTERDEASVVILPNMGSVELNNKELTYMTLTYDPAAQTLTITTEQPGIGAVHTHSFPNIDMAHILSAVPDGKPHDGKAYMGCMGRCGGSWAEDFIWDFKFDFEATSRDLPPTSALAFRHYDGTGTINHQGSAALALLGDVDYAPTDTTLCLNGGGLNLRRATDESLGFVANRGDWVSLTTNYPWMPHWTTAGDACITTNANNIIGGFASTRRVNVARDFTAKLTYISANAAADGFALSFHNDPRGPAALGGAGGSMGYVGDAAATPVGKSFALRFNIYTTTSVPNNQLSLGRNGAWVGDTERDLSGPFLRNTSTDVELSYDASAKTLTAKLTNPMGTATEAWTDVDIAGLAESDYAFVLISGATGGANAYQTIRNFYLSYPEPADVTDERLMAGGTEIPAGASQTVTLNAPNVIAPAFLIEDGIFGDGSTLNLVSQTGGTLRYANITVNGAASFDIQPGVTLALCGSDGDVTLNLLRGHADISGLTTTSSTKLNLTRGATVTAIPKRIIGGATLDGTKLTAGIYKPSNCDWVLSGQVNIGSVGTTIILK